MFSSEEENGEFSLHYSKQNCSLWFLFCIVMLLLVNCFCSSEKFENHGIHSVVCRTLKDFLKTNHVSKILFFKDFILILKGKRGRKKGKH